MPAVLPFSVSFTFTSNIHATSHCIPEMQHFYIHVLSINYCKGWTGCVISVVFIMMGHPRTFSPPHHARFQYRPLIAWSLLISILSVRQETKYRNSET